MKTITNVNSYVAWAEFQGSRSAYAQGIAESEEEFRQMCEEKGYFVTFSCWEGDAYAAEVSKESPYIPEY